MRSSTAQPLVAGVDEAGRGPLAGPVVVAAVILDAAGLAEETLLAVAREMNQSETAFVFAAVEALRRGVPLRLVHAWQMPLPQMEGSVALVTSPLQAKSQHRRLLEGVTQQVRQAYPDLVVEPMLIPDNASAALLTRAAHSSLLVLGTHRRGLLAGLTLGSVARDLLFRVPCATCIVPNPPAR